MAPENYWFRCPACRALQFINYHQAKGNEPIKCQAAGCGFKETGIVTPMVETTVAGGPNFDTKLTPII